MKEKNKTQNQTRENKDVNEIFDLNKAISVVEIVKIIQAKLISYLRANKNSSQIAHHVGYKSKTTIYRRLKQGNFTIKELEVILYYLKNPL